MEGEKPIVINLDATSVRQLEKFSGVTEQVRPFNEQAYIEHMHARPYEMSSRLGKKIVELLAQSGDPNYQKIKEDLDTSGNTVLYTTAVAAFIDQVMRPKLVAAGVIKKLSMIDQRGANSVKIPINVVPDSEDLTEGDAFTDASEDYGGETVTVGWKGTRVEVTQQLLSASNVDIIKDQVGLMGYSLAKKMDTDIIAQLQTDAPSGDANSNYIATGGASTRMNYDKFVDAIAKVKGNDAEPDFLLLNPTDWGFLMKDTDFKKALSFGTTPAGSAMPQLQEAAGLKILTSSQVTTGNSYFVDSTKIGYLVEFSETLTYDGRINTKINFELLAAKAYGIGITQKKSYCRVEMSA